MKVHYGSFSFSTRGEFDFIDLSKEVDNIIRVSQIEEGIALVFAGHATGVIIINEYEHRLKRDIQEFIEKTIPSEERYNHPGNASAHLRSMLFTPSKVVPIREGRLALGTWQRIFWLEAERRPRNRKMEVYVIGSTRLKTPARARKIKNNNSSTLKW